MILFHFYSKAALWCHAARALAEPVSYSCAHSERQRGGHLDPGPLTLSAALDRTFTLIAAVPAAGMASACLIHERPFSITRARHTGEPQENARRESAARRWRPCCAALAGGCMLDRTMRLCRTVALAIFLALSVAKAGSSQSLDQTSSPDDKSVVYYPHASRGWSGLPSIVVSGAADDPRAAPVVRAVDFWNSQLGQIGSPFHFGSITYTSETIPDDFLQQRSLGVLGDGGAPPPAPQALLDLPGDIVVALSNAEFVSFTTRVGPKILVGIRNGQSYPLRLNNVAVNVITHELGHAIGLGHNNDSTTLMCGRPAPCRPDAFATDGDRIFPITDVEAGFLQDLYPLTWTPRQS
jgi:hypothetical protein